MEYYDFSPGCSLLDPSESVQLKEATVAIDDIVDLSFSNGFLYEKLSDLKKDDCEP